MARRPDTTRADTDADYAPALECAACADADPQVRHRHYLTLALTQTFDQITAHVQTEISRTVHDSERVRSYTHDIVAWVKDQVISYSSIPAEDTGWCLPWPEGRRQTLLALRKSTAAKARQTDEDRAQREARAVRGFSRVPATV